nr:hypothetical transcript [Hymenolepis microstoma]
MGTCLQLGHCQHRPVAGEEPVSCVGEIDIHQVSPPVTQCSTNNPNLLPLLPKVVKESSALWISCCSLNAFRIHRLHLELAQAKIFYDTPSLFTLRQLLILHHLVAALLPPHRPHPQPLPLPPPPLAPPPLLLPTLASAHQGHAKQCLHCRSRILPMCTGTELREMPSE